MLCESALGSEPRVHTCVNFKHIWPWLESDAPSSGKSSWGLGAPWLRKWRGLFWVLGGCFVLAACNFINFLLFQNAMTLGLDLQILVWCQQRFIRREVQWVAMPNARKDVVPVLSARQWTSPLGMTTHSNIGRNHKSRNLTSAFLLWAQASASCPNTPQWPLPLSPLGLGRQEDATFFQTRGKGRVTVVGRQGMKGTVRVFRFSSSFLWETLPLRWLSLLGRSMLGYNEDRKYPTYKISQEQGMT